MRVLVLNEKHGNVYVNATTDEQLHAAALATLMDRFEQGEWYFDGAGTYGIPSTLKYVSPEEIEALPDHFRALARRDNSTLKMDQEAREIADVEYSLILQAIKEGDGELALRILQDRSDEGYEYERIDIDTVSETYAI